VLRIQISNAQASCRSSKSLNAGSGEPLNVGRTALDRYAGSKLLAANSHIDGDHRQNKRRTVGSSCAARRCGKRLWGLLCGVGSRQPPDSVRSQPPEETSLFF
jgi:hypothetical protein